MTSICLGCGMCCDGTMYQTVNLGAGDQIELLRTVGVVFTIKDDVSQFRQPCRAFGAGCCGAYEGRPSACRSYRCRLLRRHEADEVSHDEASALIARTIVMRDRVQAGLTACVDPKERLTLDGLYRTMMAKLDAAPDPAAARREHGELLLDFAALHMILARDFKPKDASDRATFRKAAKAMAPQGRPLLGCKDAD